MRLLALVVLVFLSTAPAAPQEGGSKAIATAIADLGSESAGVRERATDLLLAAGESARSALEAAEGSSDPEVQARASWLLLALEWRSTVTPRLEAAIPGVIRRLMEARGADLLGLLASLHETGGRETLPALRRLFRDPGRVASIERALEESDPMDRTGFEAAVGAYAIPEAEPELLALARGPHAILRRAAVAALADLATPGALRALGELKDHPDPETAVAAARGLERAGKRGEIEDLLRVASDGSAAEERRVEAIEAMARRGERRCVPGLLLLLEDGVTSLAATRALGALRAAEAAPLLERRVDLETGGGHTHNLWALARCGPRTGRATLLAALDAPLVGAVSRASIFGGLAGTRDPDVARRALATIATAAANFVDIEATPLLTPLADAEVVPVLARRLEGSGEGGAPRALAHALADRGSVSRVPLREIADREGVDPKVRAAALAALARIAEPADRERAARFAADASPLVRGAALRLLVASGADGARNKVLAGIESLRKGRISHRPGLADAMRALASDGAGSDAEALLRIAGEEAALDVRTAALEGIAQLGDRQRFRAVLSSAPKSGDPLRALAAREVARLRWKECADLIEPLLDEAGVDFGDVRDGREPSVMSNRAVREVAFETLAALFRTDPGGVDPASRAAAWHAFLAPRRGR